MRKIYKALNIFIRKKSKIIFFLIPIIFAKTVFADLTWQLPAQDVFFPSIYDQYRHQIVTNASGSIVHVVWALNSNEGIQTASSNNFGNTWGLPTTLSLITGSADPRIATDNTGKYVYVVYSSFPTFANYRILFSRSTDFGQTWTVGAAQKTLSTISPIFSMALPFIATSSNGQYVYASWANNTSGIVEFSRSTDFGETWLNPASVTIISDTDSLFGPPPPLLATDSSGQYIHALWIGKKGASVFRIQTASSSDYGITWTPFAAIHNLSADDVGAFGHDLATNDLGQYVYAVWQKSIGGATVIQFSRSADFGSTWTASPGINLSSTSVGVVSFDAKITTDLTGKYVYVIWAQTGALGESIRIIRSTDFGITWEDPVIIPVTSPSFPDLVINNSGKNVYAVWNSIISGISAVESSLSFDFAQTFTTPIRISDQSNSFFIPVITTSYSGIYAYSAFTRETLGGFQVLQVLNGASASEINKNFKIKRL